MDFGTTMVALFAIACGTGIIGSFFWMCVEVVKARALRGGAPAAAELSAIREEIRQLREQNTDLILHYDTAIQRLTAVGATELVPGQRAVAGTGAADPAVRG
jgi:hypothetical protein